MAKPKPTYGIDHFPMVNQIKTNGVYRWYVFPSDLMNKSDNWLFLNSHLAVKSGEEFTAQNAMDAAIAATDELVPQQ
jgi:hypothetical protein